MQIIFEGSEKKLEVVVRDDIHLLTWPESKIKELVSAANTQILSKIENQNVKAYLLSESSLFVWDDRFTMITCGTTTLVDAALKVFSFLPPEDIDTVIFERKNEYFAHLQKTDFFDDVKKLAVSCPGKAYRMGAADEHHLYLYHSDKKYKPKKNDTTLEILMYDLQGKAKDIFNTSGLATEKIRQETGVGKILPGFEIDDYAFEPIGYSLNAIKGEQYYTIHVTPQEMSPYVSFETNLAQRKDMQSVINNVIEVFRPRTFDVVYFDTHFENETFQVEGYERRSAVREKLTCGFTVHFGHFTRPCIEETGAFKLTIQ